MTTGTKISQAALEALSKEAIAIAAAQLKQEKAAQRFELYGHNKTVQFVNDREVLLCGPARTGKSFAWLVKLHRYATRYPNFRGLIVRKTRASLSEAALQTFEEHVLGPNHLALGSKPQRRFREVYRYQNGVDGGSGAEIIVDGMDKKTKILSTEFDIIFVQEANELSIDDLEYLRTRLSNTGIPLGDGRYFHQLIMDCNPDHPKHWLKLRCDSGKTRLLPSKHEDNPRFYDHKTNDWTPLGKDYVYTTLEGLSGVRYKRFRLGLWAAAEGAIYDDWREEIHVIDGFEIPWDWPRIRVIDFGFKNPFVCQWWAIHPTSRTMYLYREIYETQRLVEDFARQIIQLSGGTKDRENIIATICDHDAEDRATLDRYGIPNVPAFKGVQLGIQAVQSRIKIKQISNEPDLFILRDCLVNVDPRLSEAKKPVQTIDEIPGYEWEKDKDNKPVNETPRKIDDHGCDTMRYAVCYVDSIGSELETQTSAFGLLDDEESELGYAISPY